MNKESKSKSTSEIQKKLEPIPQIIGARGSF
jgi:hypothetical protein